MQVYNNQMAHNFAGFSPKVYLERMGKYVDERT